VGSVYLNGCIRGGILDCHLSRFIYRSSLLTRRFCGINWDRIRGGSLPVRLLGRNSDSNVRGMFLFAFPLDEKFDCYLPVSFYRESRRFCLDKAVT
jgi:hypothetical protein